MKKSTRPPREEIARRLLEIAARGNRIHVIRSDRGWAITREGAKRATRVLPDKQDAIELARTLAIRDSMELIVHGPDGDMVNRECF